METLKTDLVTFWRKFGALLDSGVPLLQALRTIRDESANERLKTVIAAIITAVRSGREIHASLTPYPGWFPPSVRTMVQAGEATGRVPQVCREIAEGIANGTFAVAPETEAPSAPPAPGAPPAAEEQEAAPLRIWGKIFLHAYERRATDIHVEHIGDDLRIRFRIDGILTDYTDTPIPKELQEAIVSRVKIMANFDLADKKLPQDGRIMIRVSGRDLDLRVSIVPCVMGESIVMRVYGGDETPPPLNKQGFSADELKRVRGWLQRPSGLILVAGLAGTGKTTTLYALAQELNKPGLKVITVEDPVAARLPGITQQQVRPSVGLTFSAAIAATMRQDPDILLIGEIRDRETAVLAMQSALSGHLVLATFTTPDAPSAVRRLLDLGVDSFLINNTLIGVISQRLVRMLCTECKALYKPAPAVLPPAARKGKLKFYMGKGCPACSKTGYRRRTCVHEIIEMDNTLRQLVGRDASVDELRRQALKTGLKSFLEDGIGKAAGGLTTIQEVLRVCTT